MKGEQKRIRRAGQLERALEKLFYNEAFIEEIKTLRAEVGIPPNGFKRFSEYYKYMEKDLKNKTYVHFRKITPQVFGFALKYGLPSNYAYWIEAFLALGFNYSKFDTSTPFNYPREFMAYGVSVALNIQSEKEDHVNLSIFPGASLNATSDFLREHWSFIETILESRTFHGKAPAVRKVGSRDRKKILELAENGEIDSAGVWTAWGKGNERPECITGISTDQIKHIVSDERRKKRIREGKKKRK